MSDETVETTATATPVAQPLAQEVPEEAAQEQLGQEVKLEDLKVGFVVGLTADDNFVFDVFGQDRRLADVLALKEHASRSVEKLYDQAQFGGDRLVHEVGRAVAVLNQKLDAMINASKETPDSSEV